MCIPLTHLHKQFQPYAYIPAKVREQKLKISYFFQSSREITTGIQKIIGP
jgi:hypothetical protein